MNGSSSGSIYTDNCRRLERRSPSVTSSDCEITRLAEFVAVYASAERDDACEVS